MSSVVLDERSNQRQKREHLRRRSYCDYFARQTADCSKIRRCAPRSTIRNTVRRIWVNTEQRAQCRTLLIPGKRRLVIERRQPFASSAVESLTIFCQLRETAAARHVVSDLLRRRCVLENGVARTRNRRSKIDLDN